MRVLCYQQIASEPLPLSLGVLRAVAAQSAFNMGAFNKGQVASRCFLISNLPQLYGARPLKFT
jgi:hypothetical protein